MYLLRAKLFYLSKLEPTPNNFVETEGTIREFKFESFGAAYANAADITAINIGGVNRLTDITEAAITVTSNELRSITISDAARLAIGKNLILLRS